MFVFQYFCRKSYGRIWKFQHKIIRFFLKERILQHFSRNERWEVIHQITNYYTLPGTHTWLGVIITNRMKSSHLVSEPLHCISLPESSLSAINIHRWCSTAVQLHSDLSLFHSAGSPVHFESAKQECSTGVQNPEFLFE